VRDIQTIQDVDLPRHQTDPRQNAVGEHFGVEDWACRKSALPLVREARVELPEVIEERGKGFDVEFGRPLIGRPLDDKEVIP
jgi:hypothetical protein